MAKTTIPGTDLADVLIGSGAAELFEALAGNDVIAAGGGNDELQGGDGDDVLIGEKGNDLLVGGKGADVMLGGDGRDTMVWNNGDGSDVMEGGAGYDTAIANGSDTAGDVFEISSADGRVDFQRVNFGNFSLDIGSTEKLIVNGLGGNDLIDASGLEAGAISLEAYGGDGKDTLIGGDGNDYLSGGDGNDRLEGEKGNDVMFGGAGRDTMEWDNGDGSDTMDGGAGFDTAIVEGAETAGDFFEVSSSETGVHFERTNLGPFTIEIEHTEVLKVEGLGGDDQIDASGLTAGKIKLQAFGGNGDDTIIGSDGKDLIDGGRDDDWMTGGANEDTFVFRFGNDTITDFEAGTDKIKLQVGGGFDDWSDLQYAASQQGDDLVFDFAGGHTLTLEDTYLYELSQSDFVF